MERHYEESDWTDFVNGLRSEQASEMLNHAESCQTCWERLAFCRELREFLKAESEEPPDQWIHQTLNRFAPEAEIQEAPQVFAGLISDTLLQTPVGLRSANLADRRLSFETERFRIEITAEVSARRLMTVAGHITGKSPGSSGVAGVSTELLIGSRSLSAETNDLGEFYFRVDNELTGDPLELRFRFSGGPCLTALATF